MIYLKRILTIFVFFLGFLLILIGISSIFAPKNNMKEFGMEEAAANGILGESQNSIDIVILGDSESYCSISPIQLWQETGITAYNCGTSAQKLNYTHTLLERTLEKQKPKVVMLETNAIFREVTLDSVAYNKLYHYFSIFLYHDRWKSLSFNDFGGKVRFTWTDDYKGYVYNACVAPSEIKNYMQYTKKKAPIEDINLQYVKSIRELCAANNAEFILFTAPSPVNGSYPRHNSIAALSAELDCTYIDMNLENEAIGINWSKDTRDGGDHLNHTGAMKVTHFLSEYFSKKSNLTDHRNDKRFSKWNDALLRYEATIGNS